MSTNNRPTRLNQEREELVRWVTQIIVRTLAICLCSVFIFVTIAGLFALAFLLF